MSTFPALLRRVLDDVRKDTAARGGAASADSGAVNGKKVNGESSASTPLAVPQAAIDEALRVTRESLEMVCEVEENGTA